MRSKLSFLAASAALTLAAQAAVDLGNGVQVVPNVIDAKMDGKPMTEKGIFAFALVKTAQGWRIASWAWAKQ